MRLLVLGGAGMLGRAVVAEARSRGWAAFGPASRQVDLRDRGRLAWAVEAFQPTAIVNCAAYTKVDLAEGEGREEAFAVNGDAVAHVANAAAAAGNGGARLVHVSTDYVFDGRGREPYREDEPTAPASVYGQSKRVGEEHALAYEKSLVVRTSWLFGPGGPNFAATIARAIDGGRNPLTVVADQRGAPTYTPFLARALADFSAQSATGLVHYQNREPASWYDFASAIARLWPSPSGATTSVEPVTTAEFPRPAPRPAWSVLSVERCERLLGRRVEPWEQGLALYLSMLRKGNS